MFARREIARSTWFHRPSPALGALALGALALGLPLALLAAACQAQGPRVDPRPFGFDIPPGERVPGEGRRVLVVDDQGRSVVGKIHVEVGEHRVVLLPDGQLAARAASAAPLTDRPFVEADKEALAAQVAQGPLAGFHTKVTRRFVYVYNTSEGFSQAAARVMETMFSGIVLHAKAQKIEVREPEVPLVVIMFRTEAEYQRFQRMPPGVIAYYNTVSNRVVMYEESRLGAVKPELAARQSLSTMAHEGAHQILHNIGVQQRLSLWPMWLAEGLAEYFAPTTLDAKMRWKGAGEINDLRMFELEQYLKAQDLEGPQGRMVRDTVLASRLTSTGYASAWALTLYLARNHRAEFNKFVNETSKRGPFEGFVDGPTNPANVEAFQARFGDDLDQLETRLVKYLQRQPYTDPFAEWPHFVAMVTATVEGKPRRAANSFHSPELAQKWCREIVEKVPEEQRAASRAAILEFPNRAAAERHAQLWLRSK